MQIHANSPSIHTIFQMHKMAQPARFIYFKQIEAVLFVFSFCILLQIVTSWPFQTSTSQKTALPNVRYYAPASKFKFLEDANLVSLEPVEFVDLRLRYALNQSTFDIQGLRLLQQEEFARNANYRYDWEDGVGRYEFYRKKEEIERVFQNSSVILEAPEEYHQALSAYSYTLYYYFNHATRELCSALDIRDNYTYHSFFKFLHLAMETMGPEVCRILNVTANNAPLYRVLSIQYNLEIGQEVTFQHFTSTTRLLQVAEDYATKDGTMLEIQADEDNPIDPRHKISLRIHSIFPNEDEVLLSPFQSFSVHNITEHYIPNWGVTIPKIILKPINILRT